MVELLEQLQLPVDAAMATLIWLVQLVIYPGFRVVVPDTFRDWHRRYVRTIGFIVIPLMLLQALCHGVLAVTAPSLPRWGGAVALLGAWVVTFAISAPCHQRLQKSGYQTNTIERLIKTNWLRTLFWTLALLFGICSLWV